MQEKTVENPIKELQTQKENLELIRPGEVRVRIAPAPTGPMHIGFARTALFNYLFAKKYQGILVLRIEDTDIERSKKEWEKDIIENLKWLGIETHEGPENGKKYGPYRQSERKEIYKKYIQKLSEEKKIYPCFCSKEELESHRQYLMSRGEAPCYSKKCREISEKEVEENLKNKKPFILRLKTTSKKIEFEDMLRGKIESDTRAFGDMVVAKDFSTPLYNLAVVIDDYEMKITHVIRGEDHIPNTPKQIIISEALEIKIPEYLHLPLVLGPDKSKLSKRDQAYPVSSYKNQGYLPEALINFMALLGWNPGTEREIFSMNSLVQEFSLHKIQKSGAVFNPLKLDWINGFYIRSKSLQTLTELCIPYLIKSGLIEPFFKTEQYPAAYGAETISQKFKITETNEEIPFEFLENIILLYQERLKKLSEILELIDFFFKKKLEYEKELLKWKGIGDKELKSILDKLKKILSKIKIEDWEKSNLEKILSYEADEIIPELSEKIEGLKTKDRGYLLWPLRVAITGKKASASPFEIAWLLGKEKTLERIKEAKKKL